ncbi:hook-length control protein FliK [Formivibrio citricus]|uniref:Hook-length control protein FliK n=1 Tax=Formivibrio citricus TaxID=83765 RepID=A0A1I4VBW6_9NEIS|nr:flagellar hook-length control protein FliK [Formivibrio citricus]SFM98663.1 hook-length control protein FliK [Formivibrio citricus]
MLPSNPAVSLVQNYLRTQQGVIEVAKPTPDQLLLTVGERVQATVTDQLPNGRFAVLIKDQLLDLNLPRNTQPGEQLELVVAGKEPRLTFLLSQSLQTEIKNQPAGVALSQTARLLGDLVGQQQVGNKAATVQQSAPLFEDIPHPEKLASQLASRLAESGLFYESHQAEWVNGERPLQSLLREPQAQFAERKALDAAQVTNAAKQMQVAQFGNTASFALQEKGGETLKAEVMPQPAQLQGQPEQTVRHIVQQQVQLLESHPLVWQGQAWPGQTLQWQLEVENEREAGQSEGEPQRTWQTRLDMNLPRLGEVGVVATLRGGQFTLRFEASNENTVSLLQRSQSILAGRFEAAGLLLVMSQVHHHVDETGN